MTIDLAPFALLSLTACDPSRFVQLGADSCDLLSFGMLELMLDGCSF